MSHTYNLTDQERRRLVRTLQGSSATIDEALTDLFPAKELEEEDLHQETLAFLKQNTFWCDECGYWLAKSKQSDFEHLCVGCSVEVYD
jgi:hypothetical protein